MLWACAVGRVVLQGEALVVAVRQRQRQRQRRCGRTEQPRVGNERLLRRAPLERSSSSSEEAAFERRPVSPRTSIRHCCQKKREKRSGLGTGV